MRQEVAFPEILMTEAPELGHQAMWIVENCHTTSWELSEILQAKQ